jgi:hypothetical protein
MPDILHSPLATEDPHQPFESDDADRPAFPPWVDAKTSVQDPILVLYNSASSTKMMLNAIADIIDRCDNTNISARLAISLCSPLWSELIDAIAARYSISGADIRTDRCTICLHPDARPKTHWTNNLGLYVQEKSDPRPVLASSIRRG